jgi:hypothetical protein
MKEPLFGFPVGEWLRTREQSLSHAVQYDYNSRPLTQASAEAAKKELEQKYLVQLPILREATYKRGPDAPGGRRQVTVIVPFTGGSSEFFKLFPSRGGVASNLSAEICKDGIEFIAAADGGPAAISAYMDQVRNEISRRLELLKPDVEKFNNEMTSYIEAALSSRVQQATSDDEFYRQLDAELQKKKGQ